MYIPKINEENDHERILDFIRQNGFGILVSSDKGVPVATHIPLELAFDANNAAVLRGHVARPNPQWRLWEEPSEVLAIFSGAHAYVSSSWYEKSNVSTWNYLAVHVYGTIRIVSEAELYESVQSLTEKYEKHQENPHFVASMNPQSVKREIRGIVGFEIKIDRFKAKAKLSQNRNDRDHQSIVEHLQKTDDALAHQVADEMLKRKKDDL